MPKHPSLFGLAVVTACALTACSSSTGGTNTKASSNAGSTAPASSTSAETSATSSAPQSSATSPAGGAPTGPKSGADFCALVTKPEAEAAVGTALKDGRAQGKNLQFGPTGSCVYSGATTSQKPTVVNIIALGTKVPRSIFDSEVVKGANGRKPVAGLGEVAYSIPGIVFAFDHGVVLTLEIIKNQTPVATEIIVALLRKALSRAGALG